MYIAAVQREMDQFDASLGTLGCAVEADPDSVPLLVALGSECLYAGQVRLVRPRC